MTPLLVTALMSFACLVLGLIIGFCVGWECMRKKAQALVNEAFEHERQAMEA